MATSLKFLGYVPAGFPSPASDYMDDGIDLNKKLIQRPSSTFFFKIEGDSMIGAHIPPNSIVVVDKSLSPKNNSIVIAMVNGEFTCKFFIKNMQGCLLMPANPKYKNIMITEGTEFRVWGVVTAVIIETTKYGL